MHTHNRKLFGGNEWKSDISCHVCWLPIIIIKSIQKKWRAWSEINEKGYWDVLRMMTRGCLYTLEPIIHQGNNLLSSMNNWLFFWFVSLHSVYGVYFFLRCVIWYTCVLFCVFLFRFGLFNKLRYFSLLS